MNSVACRRLLDGVDIIFPKIQKLAHGRANLNHVCSKPIEHDKLENILNKFLAIFQTLDKY